MILLQLEELCIIKYEIYALLKAKEFRDEKSQEINPLPAEGQNMIKLAMFKFIREFKILPTRGWEDNSI